MIEFKLVAVVPSKESHNKVATIYLFNKQGVLILPIEVSQKEVRVIINSLEENLENNDIYFLASNITKLLKGSLKCVILDSVAKNAHIAFVRILNNKKETFDFSVSIAQGLILAIKIQIPILVSDKVVKKYAIKITKQMLEKVI